MTAFAAPVRAVDAPAAKSPASQPVKAIAKDSVEGMFSEVQPMLATYCYSCHNEQKSKGDLDLQKMKTAVRVVENKQAWNKVMARLREKEMPPKKATTQPTDEQRQKLIAFARKVARAEINCEEIAGDKNVSFYKGYVMSRRLTRVEYNNSVRDLLGVDLHPGELLPNDGGGGEGFDNNGDTLYTSTILIEKYLKAADKVLGAILSDPNTSSPAQISAADLDAARKRLLTVTPGDSLTPRQAASRDLAMFMRRAFRRPVSDLEVQRMLTLFDKAQARGDSFQASMKLALKGVLVSPHFLFLVEPDPGVEGVYPLADYPLASRLSYFLWASIPDEELLSLADAGKLQDEEVLRQQVRRMLKDPRSKGLAETFAVQWLGIDALDGATHPDPKRFPEYDRELAEAMRQEALLLFTHILRDDRPLLDLLDCNYTFVNERLASHYGIPGVQGNQFRQVTLPDQNRGGVLSLGAVLTATSYPLRTSPVLRGKWVLEELLGAKIPPPPPNVPALPQDDSVRSGKTFRQQLEMHWSNPECASCHDRMDPIGFGLENFDPVGRWRTQLAGLPIDSSGKLSSGEAFTTPKELKQLLLKRKDEFLKNFTRKMLGFGLGRGLTQYDQCVVNDALKALSEHEYHSSALIEEIVLSKPFRYRYGVK